MRRGFSLDVVSELFQMVSRVRNHYARSGFGAGLRLQSTQLNPMAPVNQIVVSKFYVPYSYKPQ